VGIHRKKATAIFTVVLFESPRPPPVISVRKLQPGHRVKEAEERENVSKDILADDS
jgi:hypothetical protein